MSTSTPTSTAGSHRLARRAGIALAAASVLAIAGFTALGSVFDYPQILQQPVDEILAAFRDHQGAVTFWFAVLVASAALLAPAGVWIGRLVGGRLGTAVTVVAVAAAFVQVVGLQRWLTLVPPLGRAALDPAQHGAAVQRFALWHTLLGKAIGETLGYALTAAFTVLMVAALRQLGLPRWLAIAGWVSAGLIATGVVVPVLSLAALTNFVGYVLWCLWLLALAALLIRGSLVIPPTTSAIAVH